MIRVAHLMRKDRPAGNARSACATITGPNAPKMLKSDTPKGFWAGTYRHGIFRSCATMCANAAYNAALRRIVRPGSRVLEIGTRVCWR